jgi:hypothetical protein
MYLIVAFAVTVLVIALAWRGVGITRPTDEDSDARVPGPPRLSRPAPRRFVAPDDDPEFLSEIDRRLRDEGKNN